MCRINKSVLKKIGHNVRENNYKTINEFGVSGYNVQGRCINISRYIIKELLNYENIRPDDVFGNRSYIRQNNAEEIHYFVSISTDIVGDIDETQNDQQVFIDASIDQFCNEFKNNGLVDVSLGSYSKLPAVSILEPNDKKRDRYSEVSFDVLNKNIL